MDEVLTDSTYLILLALLEPKHGYGIMKDITEIAEGRISVGPASMYTILKKLEKQEHIALQEDSDRKKVYLITESGKEVLKKDIERRKLFYLAGETRYLESEGRI